MNPRVKWSFGKGLAQPCPLIGGETEALRGEEIVCSYPAVARPTWKRMFSGCGDRMVWWLGEGRPAKRSQAGLSGDYGTKIEGKDVRCTEELGSIGWPSEG